MVQDHQVIEARLGEVEQELRNQADHSDERLGLKIFNEFLWPYLIILALCLKLAKAVVELRQRRARASQ
jgi:hypothetical protein